jgi:hypothetical protein
MVPLYQRRISSHASPSPTRVFPSLQSGMVPSPSLPPFLLLSSVVMVASQNATLVLFNLPKPAPSSFPKSMVVAKVLELILSSAGRFQSVLLGLVLPENLANVSNLLRFLFLPLQPVLLGVVFPDVSNLPEFRLCLLNRLWRRQLRECCDREEECVVICGRSKWVHSYGCERRRWPEVLSRKRKSQARAMSLDIMAVQIISAVL